MKRFIFFLAILQACCSERTAREGDAQTDAIEPPAHDASSETTWGAPRRLVELGSPADERFPVLTDNALTIYFTRTEQIGSLTVNVPYRAHRPNLQAPFGPPSRAATFGTTSVADLEFAASGLEWFFWKGLGQLAVSTRENLDAPWSQPNNLGIDGFSPSTSATGLSLYFIGLDKRIYVLDRQTPTSPWTAPKRVDIAAPFEIKSIDISRDDLTLLIATPIDSFTAGVLFATRTSARRPFENPTAIPSLRGAYQNARFAPGDTAIVASGEFDGNSELFLSTLTPTTR